MKITNKNHCATSWIESIGMLLMSFFWHVTWANADAAASTALQVGSREYKIILDVRQFEKKKEGIAEISKVLKKTKTRFAYETSQYAEKLNKPCSCKKNKKGP